MSVGLFDVVAGGVLALLAVVVIVSIVVLALSGAMVSVVAPTMAAINAAVSSRRRRAWRRAIRESWVPDFAGVQFSVPVDPHRPPVRGVALTRTQDAGAHIRFAAAQVAADGGDDTGPGYTSAALARARLRPGGRLALPTDPEHPVVGYVLAGHGTVGVQARPVCAGQFLVFEPGTAVLAMADRDGPGLDVLVLGPAAADQRGPAEADIAAVRQRLGALRAQIDDLLPAAEHAVSDPRSESAPAA